LAAVAGGAVVALGASAALPLLAGAVAVGWGWWVGTGFGTLPERVGAVSMLGAGPPVEALLAVGPLLTLGAGALGGGGEVPLGRGRAGAVPGTRR